MPDARITPDLLRDNVQPAVLQIRHKYDILIDILRKPVKNGAQVSDSDFVAQVTELLRTRSPYAGLTQSRDDIGPLVLRFQTVVFGIGSLENEIQGLEVVADLRGRDGQRTEALEAPACEPALDMRANHGTPEPVLNPQRDDITSSEIKVKDEPVDS